MAEARGRATGPTKQEVDMDTIKREVSELLKKNDKLTTAEQEDLARKYSDQPELVAKIFSIFNKKMLEIHEKARDIARKFYEQYGKTKTSSQIYNKLQDLKTKHGFSDRQLNEIRNEMAVLINTGGKGTPLTYTQHKPSLADQSKLKGVFGALPPKIQDRGLVIDATNKKEVEALKDILKCYDDNKLLHGKMIINSLVYRDCDPVAMSGGFKRDLHNPNNFIHPLIAAMFLIKVGYFEDRFLRSNFGQIVYTRNSKQPITSDVDAKLYKDITSDPNDYACDVDSVMTDIKMRYDVQVQLWKTVMKLRSGSFYYSDTEVDVLKKLGLCRNNLDINMDSVLSTDEGGLIRRLMNVFSARPTIIYSEPHITMVDRQMITSGNMFDTGNLKLNMSIEHSPMQQSFINQAVPTTTNVAMLTLRLPDESILTPITSLYNNPIQPRQRLSLREAAIQTIWVTENGVVVPRRQSLLYSNEVLVIYVNRRMQPITNMGLLSNIHTPQIANLPKIIENFEKFNGYAVQVPEKLAYNNSEIYDLRSVVTVTNTDLRTRVGSTYSIITGSNALIMKHRDFVTNLSNEYYLYDPFGASIPVKHPQGGYVTNKPITILSPYYNNMDSEQLAQSNNTSNDKSFFERASCNGTVFFYCKPKVEFNESLVLGPMLQ